MNLIPRNIEIHTIYWYKDIENNYEQSLQIWKQSDSLTQAIIWMLKPKTINKRLDASSESESEMGVNGNGTEIGLVWFKHQEGMRFPFHTTKLLIQILLLEFKVSIPINRTY